MLSSAGQVVPWQLAAVVLVDHCGMDQCNIDLLAVHAQYNTTNKQTNKQANKRTDTPAHTHTYIHTYIQTDRQTDRQTDIHTLQNITLHYIT